MNETITIRRPPLCSLREMSNTDRPIISVGTSMDDNTPSDELVVSIDVPEIVGIWHHILATVNRSMIAEHLAEAIDAMQRSLDAGLLYTEAVILQKAHRIPVTGRGLEETKRPEQLVKVVVRYG